MPAATPVLDRDTDTADDVDHDVPWNVLLLNDPVTDVRYVVGVLQKLFGFDRAKAEKVTLEVHNNGKGIVSSGSLAEAEADTLKLMNAGLWSRYEKAGS